MSRWRLALLGALVVAALSAAGARSDTARADDGEAATPTTVVANDFIPEDRNLSDCISAVPKPGCGSKARGGWHQTLVFVVLAVGLAFIGWRIVRGARAERSQHEHEETVDDPR